jgi:hypothetical protein
MAALEGIGGNLAHFAPAAKGRSGPNHVYILPVPGSLHSIGRSTYAQNESVPRGTGGPTTQKLKVTKFLLD